MNRREFLRSAAAVGAAATIFKRDLPDAFAAAPGPLPGGSILDLSAAGAPLVHVVVLVMEHRSFDHHLGWLRRDAAYRENGRRRYGRGFRVNASNRRAYRKPNGSRVATYHLTARASETNPYRGCN